MSDVLCFELIRTMQKKSDYIYYEGSFMISCGPLVLRPFLQLYIVGNLSLNMVAKTSLDCARNTLLCLWGLFIYIYQHVRNLSGWQNRCVYRTYPHLFSIWLMQFEWLSVCSRECEQAWMCEFFIWNTVKKLLIYSVCETESVWERKLLDSAAGLWINSGSLCYLEVHVYKILHVRV